MHQVNASSMLQLACFVLKAAESNVSCVDRISEMAFVCTIFPRFCDNA
jgi:hypothetical protein